MIVICNFTINITTVYTKPRHRDNQSKKARINDLLLQTHFWKMHFLERFFKEMDVKQETLEIELKYEKKIK